MWQLTVNKYSWFWIESNIRIYIHMCYLIQSSYFKLFFQSAALGVAEKKNVFKLLLESTLEPVLFFTLFIFFLEQIWF